MRKGTTPIHHFTVDLDLTTATEIYLTYKQGCKEIIEKTKKDMTITPDTVEVTLTQQETLAFSTCDLNHDKVEIQFRAKFTDGSAVASNIMTATVLKILKGGEI